MNNMTNPFFLTGIISDEYFCDREQETEKLIRHLPNHSNVLLTSSRRMGKTHLIRHIINDSRIKNNYYTFYTDIYATTSLREMVFLLGKEIYQTLVPGEKKALKLFLETIRTISMAFSLDPVSGEPRLNLQIGDIDNPELTLEEIFTYLEKADKPCIFAIDEFQQISRYPEKNMEALLRTYIQMMNNCNFIFSGSDKHNLQQMFFSYSKPFYYSTQPMHLNRIEKEKYTDFVIKHFEKAGIAISPDTVGYCYDMFSGYTYYYHRVFHDVFTIMEANGTVDENVIRQTVDNILEENSNIFGEILSSMTIAQKQMLVAVAKEGSVKRPTSGAFIKKYSLLSTSSVQKALENSSTIN